jgi:transposase-like protein
MSTTVKKGERGIRYTDAQKKEIVDFVVEYNATNGRGGQSTAAEKFQISPLTVAAWLKAAGVRKSKSKSKAKSQAPKKAPKLGKNKPGTRYTAEQKQEVVDFATSYNAANKGRGGQTKAAAHFQISPLTVVAWMKAAGVRPGSKKDGGRKIVTRLGKATISGDFDSKMSALMALRKQIGRAESDLAQLLSKFEALKTSL